MKKRQLRLLLATACIVRYKSAASFISLARWLQCDAQSDPTNYWPLQALSAQEAVLVTNVCWKHKKFPAWRIQEAFAIATDLPPQERQWLLQKLLSVSSIRELNCSVIPAELPSTLAPASFSSIDSKLSGTMMEKAENLSRLLTGTHSA